MKEFIYAVNSTVGTAIIEDGVYSPNNIVRRYGCAMSIQDGGIAIEESGYYDVKVIANVTATEASNVTVSIYQNNVLIDSKTVTAKAVGDQLTIPLEAIVKVRCACMGSRITVVIGGQPTTSYSLSEVITKRA